MTHTKESLLGKTKQQLITIILRQQLSNAGHSTQNLRLSSLFNSNLKRIDGIIRQLVYIRDYPYSRTLSKGTYSRKK